MGGAVGLDFGAILAMGSALEADRRMLAELLPTVEVIALRALEPEDGGDLAEENDQ